VRDAHARVAGTRLVDPIHGEARVLRRLGLGEVLAGTGRGRRVVGELRQAARVRVVAVRVLHRHGEAVRRTGVGRGQHQMITVLILHHAGVHAGVGAIDRIGDAVERAVGDAHVDRGAGAWREAVAARVVGAGLNRERARADNRVVGIGDRSTFDGLSLGEIADRHVEGAGLRRAERCRRSDRPVRAVGLRGCHLVRRFEALNGGLERRDGG